MPRDSDYRGFNTADYDFVLAYGRYSSAQQGGGQSQQRQEGAALEALLQRTGWKLLDQYFDPGVSGGRGKHRALGALRDLVSRVNRGEFPPRTVLVVETFDRLSREATSVALIHFLSLIEKGLGIYFSMDRQGYDKRSINRDASQLFVSIGMMLSANGVFKVMSDRSLRGWQRRRELGKKGHVCPSWLIRTADGSGYDFKLGAKALIRRLFDEAQYLGLDKIVARLNAEHIPPFTAFNRVKQPLLRRDDGEAIWHGSMIHRILTGRAVRGEQQIGRIEWTKCQVDIDGETYDYEEPNRVLTGEVLHIYPIAVSEDEFRRTKAALDARQTGRGRKGAGFPNLLQGLSKCAHCGQAMWFKSWPNGQRMVCSGTRSQSCSGDNTRQYDYAEVERQLLNVFGSVVARYIALSAPQNDPAQLIHNQIAKLQAEVDAIGLKQQNTRRALEKAAEQSGRGDIAVEDALGLFTYGDDRRERLAEIAKLQVTLAQTAASPPLADVLQQTNELIAQLSTVPAKDRYAVRATINAHLKRFISRIAFTVDGVMTVHFIDAKPSVPAPVAGRQVTTDGVVTDVYAGYFPDFVFQFTADGVITEHRGRAKARVERSGPADRMGGFTKPPIFYDSSGNAMRDPRKPPLPPVKRSPADEIISAEIDKRRKV